LRDDINFFKNKVKNLEKNLTDKNNFEEKLKKEIESYKRQINFYKEKMKIDICNTTKKLENLNNLNSNFDNFKNLLSPKRSKKSYNKENTLKLKKKDEISKNVNFEDIHLNEFNPKLDNKEFTINKKDDNSKNIFLENVLNSENTQNKSFNLVNSKISFEKEFHNSSNFDVKKNSNHSSNKDKKDIKSNNLQIKRFQETKLKEKSLKIKHDENSNYKKIENEKIIQNNCQNIYNLNINPVGKKIFFKFIN